jgi:hypothetical protein
MAAHAGRLQMGKNITIIGGGSSTFVPLCWLFTASVCR